MDNLLNQQPGEGLQEWHDRLEAIPADGLSDDQQQARALQLRHAKAQIRWEGERREQGFASHGTETIPSAARPHTWGHADPAPRAREPAVPEEFRQLWDRASQADREA